ncbi:hypothetical protein GCM10010358_19260 [Streptomyces minutiscleroticus]|uniref:Uncharacterized protein n=1 Tax=Streptomyces minutiscleroticus TaxID=68238 RepID=A0A918KIG1_9ACTN|nr:hypothetical protein [Streptomyces minutiscleroticus]GGX65035.1 hypothetical protein GCM10010358_19260 [Streptomyces minutiscleroticus]
MANEARERLGEAIEPFGHEGRLFVVGKPGDLLGESPEGADPAPHSAMTAPVDGRPPLIERVREANARSRGELL